MSVVAQRPNMLAEHAAELASRGWHVFPCRPGNKRPAVDRWEERACADPQRVAPHWPAGANIGLACGPSGLVVVDLDTHGTLPDEWRLPGVRDGRDVLAQLCEWAGQLGDGVFALGVQPGQLLALVGGEFLIDTRAAGGYIVAPPSVVDGRPYELLDDRDPEPLPRLVAASARAAARAALRAHGNSRSGEPGRTRRDGRGW